MASRSTSTTRGASRPAAASARALAAIAIPFGPAPITANVGMTARITALPAAAMCGTNRPVALLRVEEGDHGQHPPMVVGRRRQAQRCEDVLDVLFDGVLGDEQPLGDRLVGSPLGHQRQ